MTSITKGYKFRIYPNPEQTDLLVRSFGCARFVYNVLLAKAKEDYKLWKDGPNLPKPDVSGYSLVKQIKKIKQHSEHHFLAEVSNIILQQSALALGAAFTNFFQNLKDGKKAGYPRFKVKHDRNSIRLTKLGFTFKNGEFYIAKSKDPIDVRWSRELPSRPSSVTISRDPDGKFYASFNCQVDPILTNGTGSIGIDVGIADYVVFNTGERIQNPRYLIKVQRNLRKHQRRLSRKQKGSNNRNKVRIKVAKCHKRVSNQRADFAHKLSRKIVNENQVVCFEGLQIKNMIKNRKLAKHISDVSWSKLFEYIKYKALESHHCNVFIAGSFYPSSHLCSVTGERLDRKLSLSERSWKCPHCGQTHDRDMNAAQNLLNLALKANIEHNPDNNWIGKIAIC